MNSNVCMIVFHARIPPGFNNSQTAVICTELMVYIRINNFLLAGKFLNFCKSVGLMERQIIFYIIIAHTPVIFKIIVHLVACIVTLVGCAVPLGYSLQVQRHQCGPHQGVAMKEAVTALIFSGPGHVTSSPV